MQTKSFARDEVKRVWWIVDAAGKNLGRLASEVASVIRGKRKPTYTPNADTGDFVIVVNAEKIEMTGNKWQEKKYYNHSRHFGGLKIANAEELRAKSPEDLIQNAVQGMLPKRKLGRVQLGHLNVYKGPDHPHKSQNPQALEIKD
jgi:large subunit ribosomal protein L13